MHGAIGEGLLPGFLRDLYVGRKTGYLYFSRPGQNCAVLFRGGHIVHASTDDPIDWLGEVLVRNGLLEREHFEQARAQAEREKKRLGRVLCDLGLIQAERLEEGMALQVRQILFRVFSWVDGGYRFEPMNEVTSQDVTLKVSTGDMILEAVRRMDPEAVVRAMGDLDARLVLSADPLLLFQNIKLTPSDVYVFSRVDGTLTARQVVQAVPLDAHEATRCLFGLLCTGVIERLPPVPRERAPSRTVEPPIVAAPVAVPPAPPAAGSAEDMNARRREIVDAFEGLQARTHYELLGIPRTATDVEAKEAYFRMARRFHPDGHHHAALADLGPRLEAVFVRVVEAYEVLRHKHSRASYDRSHPSAGTAAPAPSAPPPPAQADPALDRKTAAANVRRGEKHLADAQYWDAIQLFEGALDHVDGPLKRRALLGLSRALVRNPNWVKRAEETLQELLRIAPQHVEGLLELALLYKASGLRSRALTAFRRVLELEADNEQALLNAAELEPPPPPEPPAGSGLIKKLFRR